MSKFRFSMGVGLVLLLVGILLGCSTKTSPSGDNSVFGRVDEAVYSYHYWEEGLAVLLWHDLSYGTESCSGVGSTEDSLYRLMCSVASEDGRHFSWELHTEDGKTADLWINNLPYDLSQGTMFLVHWQEDGLEVKQVVREFSEITVPDNAAIEALAVSDGTVAEFIEEIPAP